MKKPLAATQLPKKSFGAHATFHARSAARLNRNFLNYPLARDARTVAAWRQDRETRRWFCTLPYEDRVRLFLPADAGDARRLPSAFDMNVVFYLLAEVQRTKAAVISLPPSARLLQFLGMASHADNRALLRRTFDFWLVVSVGYENVWYGRKNELFELPPPLMSVERDGYRTNIEIHEVWVRLALDKGFKERVPLPLPAAAAAQNAALMILTSAVKSRDDEVGFEVHYKRRQTGFARKCGIGRKARRKRLVHALDEARDWFDGLGGSLIHRFSEPGDGGVRWLAFIVERPQLRNVSVQKPAEHFARSRSPNSRAHVAPEPSDSSVDVVPIKIRNEVRKKTAPQFPVSSRHSGRAKSAQRPKQREQFRQDILQIQHETACCWTWPDPLAPLEILDPYADR